MFRKRLAFFFWIFRFRTEWLRAALLARLVSVRSTSHEAPFFIIGCGRSGNTVLRRVLCENYDVAIPPENPFIYSMVKNMVLTGRNGRIEAGLGSLRRELTKPRVRSLPDGTFYKIDKLAEFSLDFDALAEELRQRTDVTIADIFSAVYQDNARRQRRNRWGDKTPVMVFNYPLIRKLYPQARFVFMVRDPVDCAASYLLRMNVPVARTAARWSMAARVAQKIHHRDPNSILTLRYEDLVFDQTGACDRLKRFLSLSALPSNAPAYVYGDDKLMHHEKSKAPLNEDSIGKGDKKLKTLDVEFLRHALGDEGQIYDYPFYRARSEEKYARRPI